MYISKYNKRCWVEGNNLTNKISIIIELTNTALNDKANIIWSDPEMNMLREHSVSNPING